MMDCIVRFEYGHKKERRTKLDPRQELQYAAVYRLRKDNRLSRSLDIRPVCSQARPYPPLCH